MVPWTEEGWWRCLGCYVASSSRKKVSSLLRISSLDGWCGVALLLDLLQPPG